MAQRLAEVRSEVENAVNEESAKSAKAEQDRLILALWEKREVLPEQLATDRRVRSALEVLGTLAGDPYPWRRGPRGSSSAPDAIEAFDDNWKELVTSISVLAYKRDAKGLGPENPELPLSDEEQIEREKLHDLSLYLLLGTDVRRMPGGLRPDLSDDEAIALLEQRVGSALDEAQRMLTELRSMILNQ